MGDKIMTQAKRKEERQARRSRVSVLQPSDKFGASDSSQSVERPLAPQFKPFQAQPYFTHEYDVKADCPNDVEVYLKKDVLAERAEHKKSEETLVRDALRLQGLVGITYAEILVERKFDELEKAEALVKELERQIERMQGKKEMTHNSLETVPCHSCGHPTFNKLHVREGVDYYVEGLTAKRKCFHCKCRGKRK